MQTQPQTLRLDRPRLLQNQKRPGGGWAFYLFMLLLGALCAFGCVVTAFQVPVSTGPLMLAGLACSGFWLWRHTDSSRRLWLASLLGWAIWLLFLFFLWEDVLRGALRIINLMLRAYSGRLNYELPTLTLPGLRRTYHSEEECTAFLGVLLFPFAWWLSRMLVKRKSPLGAFCLTAVFLLLPMGFSILPAGWAYGGLLLFWCSLLLTALPLTGRKSAVLRRGRFQAGGPAGGALLLVPLAALFSLLVVYWASPPESYSRPDLVNQLRQGVTEGFGLSFALQGGQGNGNNRVDLNRMGSRSYSGKTMLRVKFDWDQQAGTQKEYLKSFVGSVYTGSSWERLDPQASAALEATGLQAQTLPARYRREMYVKSIDQQGGYQLSVENLGANPRCVYIPYGLETDSPLSPYGAELVGDSFAKSTNLFTGTKSYQLRSADMPWGWRYFDRASRFLEDSLLMPGSLRTIFGDAWGGMGVMIEGSEIEEAGASEDVARWREHRRRFIEQLLKPGQAESLTDYLEESYAVDLARQECLQKLSDDLLHQEPGWTPQGELDLWKTPYWFRALFDQEPAALMAAVEDYTDFAYQYYTQVPEELAEFLDRYREAFSLKPVLSSGSLEFNGVTIPVSLDLELREHPLAFAGRVAMVFQQYYTYTLDPPQPGTGTDFVEFFLDSSHQGYCVHFATAAVMLLRSAGYPARYAEGYVVPSGETGWVEVPDYNAHAWVEVYCAGSGWVPLEVTPPSPDAPAVYANARVPEFTDAALTPAPRPDGPMPTLAPRSTTPRQTAAPARASAAPRATVEPQATAPSGGSAAGKRETPPWVLPLALSLLGALAALLLNRQLRRWARRKALSQQDRNQAALSAYAYLLKLYQWQALCGQQDEPPARWLELAEKARFGPGTLAQEELDELLEAAQGLARLLRQQLPKLSLIRCWLAGLV